MNYVIMKCTWGLMGSLEIWILHNMTTNPPVPDFVNPISTLLSCLIITNTKVLETAAKGPSKGRKGRILSESEILVTIKGTRCARYFRTLQPPLSTKCSLIFDIHRPFLTFSFLGIDSKECECEWELVDHRLTL